MRKQIRRKCVMEIRKGRKWRKGKRAEFGRAKTPEERKERARKQTRKIGGRERWKRNGRKQRKGKKEGKKNCGRKKTPEGRKERRGQESRQEKLVKGKGGKGKGRNGGRGAKGKKAGSLITYHSGCT